MWCTKRTDVCWGIWIQWKQGQDKRHQFLYHCSLVSIKWLSCFLKLWLNCIHQTIFNFGINFPKYLMIWWLSGQKIYNFIDTRIHKCFNLSLTEFILLFISSPLLLPVTTAPSAGALPTPPSLLDPPSRPFSGWCTSITDWKVQVLC